MAKSTSGWYIFEDGFRAWFHGMSKSELKRETIKHGKLIRFIAD